MAALITGIDVSRWQGEVDFAGVAGAGHQFAFLKATDGVRYSYVDWFHRHRYWAWRAGLVVGAYHFLLDHHSGAAQARYYVAEVNRSGGFTGVVPIVDIEREADGTTPRIGHLRDFVGEFRRLVPGRPILIYTGRWYWVGVIGNPYGADLGPLWHSEYDGISPISFDVANGPELEVYGGWSDCLVWQHTSSGRCPGVSGSVDLNIFYGERSTLDALAGYQPAPAPPPPPKGRSTAMMTSCPHPDGQRSDWFVIGTDRRAYHYVANTPEEVATLGGGVPLDGLWKSLTVTRLGDQIVLMGQGLRNELYTLRHDGTQWLPLVEGPVGVMIAPADNL